MTRSLILRVLFISLLQTTVCVTSSFMPASKTSSTIALNSCKVASFFCAGGRSHTSHNRQQRRLVQPETKTWMTHYPNIHENNNNNDKSSRKLASFGRAGGRSKSPNKKTMFQKKDDESFFQKALPFTLLLVVLNPIFGFVFGGFGGSSSSNFVYYQSSYYETTSYNLDGSIKERTTNKSVKSNIPNMIIREEDNGVDRTTRTKIQSQSNDNDDDGSYVREKNDYLLFKDIDDVDQQMLKILPGNGESPIRDNFDIFF